MYGTIVLYHIAGTVSYTSLSLCSRHRSFANRTRMTRISEKAMQSARCHLSLARKSFATSNAPLLLLNSRTSLGFDDSAVEMVRDTVTCHCTMDGVPGPRAAVRTR
jgi:hypothetical protein